MPIHVGGIINIMKKATLHRILTGMILGAILAGPFFFDVQPAKAATDYSGTYTIRSAKNSGMVLDVEGGAASGKGANVIQWPYHGGANQQWRLELQADGSYTITTLLPNGYLMDVYGGYTAAGTKIIDWSGHGGDNQRWFLRDNGDGTFTIESKQSGLVLDVYGGYTTQGTNIIQWGSHGGLNQRWILESVKPCTITFNSNGGSAVSSQEVTSGRTAAQPGDPTRTGYTFGGWYADPGLTDSWDFGTDKVTTDMTLYARWNFGATRTNLDISGSTLFTIQSKSNNLFMGNDGSGFAQNAYAIGASAQQWQFARIGDNFLVLSLADGKALEVPGGGTAAGTELAMAAQTNGMNQQWKVIDSATLLPITGYPLPGREYLLQSAASGLYADIPNVSTATGTRLIQWTYNGGNNQLFVIAPGLSIIGTSEVSEAKMLSYILNNYGPQPAYDTAYITTMVSEYYRLEKVYGVRADIALSQALHETGWYRYGGLVLPDQNNYAGIYATGGYPNGYTGTESIYGADPSKVSLVIGEKAARFSSIQAGVEGHVQHLFGYAKGEVSVDSNKDGIYELASFGTTLASPRYRLLEASKLGSAPILQGLAGKWAVPGTGYSSSILKILYNAYTY